MKNRIVWVDWLETIGIFFVILYHSTLYSSDFLSDPSPIIYLRYFLKTILSSCVPLFFFANGYLLFNKPLNLKKHIKKTIRYIFLAFIWGAITMLLLMPIRNEYLSKGELFWAVIQWKQGWINHLWYLGTLVCIYIFFPLIKIVHDNNKKVFYYFVIAAFILTFGNVILNHFHTMVFFFIDGTTTIQGYNFFNIFNPFREIYGYSLVYFCCGGLISSDYIDRTLHISVKIRNTISILCIFLSALGLGGIGILYSSMSNKMWDIVWNGYDTIFTFIIVISIFVLSLNCKKQHRMISLISKNTLGIYFLQGIIIALTRPIIQTIPRLCCFSFNLIYAAAVLLICLGITVIIKKVPLLKMIC